MKLKKKYNKRIFSGVLSAVMLTNFCTVMPISVFAKDDEKQEVSSDNGHRYQLFDMPMDWNEAEAYCESLGGHLATITSEEEQTKIEELLTIGTRNSYWLGASDQNYDGNWQWITNEEFSYHNWANRQPDRSLTATEISRQPSITVWVKFLLLQMKRADRPHMIMTIWAILLKSLMLTEHPNLSHMTVRATTLQQRTDSAEL